MLMDGTFTLSTSLTYNVLKLHNEFGYLVRVSNAQEIKAPIGCTRISNPAAPNHSVINWELQEEVRTLRPSEEHGYSLIGDFVVEKPSSPRFVDFTIVSFVICPQVHIRFPVRQSWYPFSN